MSESVIEVTFFVFDNFIQRRCKTLSNITGAVVGNALFTDTKLKVELHTDDRLAFANKERGQEVR